MGIADKIFRDFFSKRRTDSQCIDLIPLSPKVVVNFRLTLPNSCSCCVMLKINVFVYMFASGLASTIAPLAEDFNSPKVAGSVS